MYKLFISGKGGVGKTSTACSLTGGEAPSTHCETPGNGEACQANKGADQHQSRTREQEATVQTFATRWSTEHNGVLLYWVPAARKAEKVKLLWCNLLNSAVLSWPGGSQFKLLYDDNNSMVTQTSASLPPERRAA